jgi:hypothetical protein
MTDIVERIRKLRFVHIPGTSDLMEEACQEIERLRAAIRRLADQDATLSVQGGNVTVTIDAKLTSEEREAVTYFSDYGETPGEASRASTLRSLLERLK